jgi:drug/metabolite transporter (DMT)-like permease
VQPFAYLQLVFASSLGLIIFAEQLRSNVVIGASLIVAAGIFTLLRERAKAKAALRLAREPRA